MRSARFNSPLGRILFSYFYAGMTMRLAINFQELTLGYDRHPAVSRLQTEIIEGSLTAIVGPNGAGKSTLMKLAYWVVKPDAGEIFWKGQKINYWKTTVARGLGIGLVFQHFSLFETLSVVDRSNGTFCSVNSK